MRGSLHSLTAVRVARSLVSAAHDAELKSLLPPELVEQTSALLEHAGLLKPWHRAVFRSRLYWQLMGRLEQHATVGMLTHMVLRKRFVHDEASEALDQGARQLVVLGGGFDTLAIRLAATHPGALCVHSDHPRTLDTVRSALATMGRPRDNVRLLAADLARITLDDALASVDGWDTSARSIVVAEGLLMYLPPEAVSATFGAVTRSAGAGSRVILSYLRADHGGRIGEGELGVMTRASLALVGEPMRWGAKPGELEAMLGAHGFSLLDDLEGARFDLERRYLDPQGIRRPLATLERVAVAQRS